MVDHRRTPSQRAYQLPGWFFVLTGLVGVLSLAAAVWVFVANPFPSPPASRSEDAAPSAASSPSASPKPTTSAAPSSAPSSGPTGEGRDGIDVLVLNATTKAGLAARVAKTAEDAGWTVGDVDNWIYGAAVNAVYYPPDHQDEGELLADDLDIVSVRPAISGMSDDDLTVLLVSTP